MAREIVDYLDLQDVQVLLDTVNFAIALFLGMVIGGVGWLPKQL